MLGDGTLERRELHHERTLFARSRTHVDCTKSSVIYCTGNVPVPVKRHLGYSTGKGICDLLVRVRRYSTGIGICDLPVRACLRRQPFYFRTFHFQRILLVSIQRVAKG